MTENQLQFRVGIFVVFAMTIAGVMIFKFGEFRSVWEDEYILNVHFDAAPGVFAASPVQMNGVNIGAVKKVLFDQERGGVTVRVTISTRYQLREDSRPRLVRSLLGDTTIEFTPGISPEYLKPGALLDGEPSPDPLEIVRDLEEKMTVTLASFSATSNEWQKVAHNLNNVMETNHGNIDLVVERTAEALEKFSATMETANTTLGNANRVIGNPKYHAALEESLEALPAMVRETHATVLSVRRAVFSVEENLTNLKNATAPLAKHSTSIVVKLDNSMGNLEKLLAELNQFSRLLNREEGTLQKLANDPELYRNLNQSAGSLAVLLKNLEPVVRDMRIFSDKVARHPELIGVAGAVQGSSGLKDPPPEAPPQQSEAPGRTYYQRR